MDEQIKLPVRYDEHHFIIYDADNRMLCDIYGRLSTHDKEKGNAIGNQIADALNATRREAALVDALSRIDLRVNSQYDHDGCCNTCQDSLNRIGDEAEQALAGHKGDKSDEAKGDL